jgi:hypothetical protein
VRYRPSEAVEPPDDNSVKPAPMSIGREPVQIGSPIIHVLTILTHKLPAAALDIFAEFASRAPEKVTAFNS